MSLQLEPAAGIAIDGVAYRVAEHPAVPGMAYAQEGRQATVYQLLAADAAESSGQTRRALKVFKSRYRVPGLVSLSDRLEPLAALPGLQVCRRTVLSAHRHADLLRRYPDFTYAVLMPWIDGATWFDVLASGKPLAPEQSLALARGLAGTLATLEEHAVAHCDLSGPNLILPELRSALVAATPGQFNNSDGIALDAQGNLYVADFGNDRIQKLALTGQ